MCACGIENEPTVTRVLPFSRKAVTFPDPADTVNVGEAIEVRHDLTLLRIENDELIGVHVAM